VHAAHAPLLLAPSNLSNPSNSCCCPCASLSWPPKLPPLLAPKTPSKAPSPRCQKRSASHPLDQPQCLTPPSTPASHSDCPSLRPVTCPSSFLHPNHPLPCTQHVGSTTMPALLSTPPIAGLGADTPHPATHTQLTSLPKKVCLTPLTSPRAS
jgi:hypothetical protein